MIKLFSKYFSVGILNTLIHWGIFSILYATGSSQTLANFGAFCVAVTFSFFVNAKWTFNAEASTIRYMIYVLFMGSVALLVGWISDKSMLQPLYTLIIFSLISLICGFLYSKYIVFRDAR
ncbi:MULTISPECIES: GtrA family protein [Pantoea]|uniref:GtrA family protein n=1 Tax=Pantoea TaxID=53335 RepID=UPI000CEB78EC|nr:MULTISPECIES: GtrA family protein [Pantoea]AVG76159.1 GtrA family protein [Pantoea ananatis]MCS4494082.1 GtrA family protein [Pantoea sp. B623]MDN4129700.1 GtrA family protein [Pantoea ananatis]MDN4149842.1 GtrA family protein [Pantoea ananatis]NEK81562.1 GtrA family protein [Pantoea ananatis]